MKNEQSPLRLNDMLGDACEENAAANLPTHCDACGRNMNSSSGATVIGVQIQFSDGSEPGLMAEIYPEVESGRLFRVCLVCWLRSLGVKV